MENESRVGRWMSSASEWLNEQTWFQQLKGKWEELDPQSRGYLKIAATAISATLIVGLMVSAVWGVHKKKVELGEKQELLTLLQNANEEIRKLRETTQTAAAAGGDNKGGDWQSYLEATAGTAGIEKTSLNISAEKPGGSNELAKEALIDITAKHISLRQVVRYAFSLENGARPVKLRALNIDTGSDPTGYMDASLAVSAFNLQEKK